jgi:L-seryl-tRNA(Ser) seleniumtransferase
VVLDAIREVLQGERESIRAGEKPSGRDALVEKIARCVRLGEINSLRRVVNATGVILHTNLGRAPMSADAADAMREVAAGYCNLEYDLVDGVRTRRGVRAERLLARLTGCEDALIVNNNAAAVLLTLNSLADGREVIVSRGEMIEIGGSFRLPDIMAKSGATLVEVGTTNKTYLKDYENAITDRTGLILKAHWSNYSIVGFTSEAEIEGLAALGDSRGVPVAYDVGSGAMHDLGELDRGSEPVVPESVAAGASAVTFSGDKLLGGPQAGMIVGRREVLDRLRANPLARAFRVDKCYIAALEKTLQAYLCDDWRRLPAVAALLATPEELRRKTNRLKRALARIGGGLTVEVADGESEAGGGSLPQAAIPSKVIRLRAEGKSAGALAAALRGAEPPVIPRVKENWVILDPRTVLDRHEEKWIIAAVVSALGA